MTEAEWLAATDPKLMLEFLRGKTSELHTTTSLYTAAVRRGAVFGDCLPLPRFSST
jgi:hypothetical protein